MRPTRPLPFVLLGLLLCCAPLHAQEPVDAAKLKAAIERGVAYLSALQQPDGSFQIPPANKPLEPGFPMGYTALATLTLLKCGTPPDDPSIEKAFRHLYGLTLRRTYSVAMLILCIEARYVPPKKLLVNEKKSYVSVTRKFFRGKARKADLAKLQECVDWLVARRSQNFAGAGWRYPSAPTETDQDNSCTQYAMLALKGARRLGAKIPLEVFEKIADFLVAQQDPTGPEVPWFRVPAADGPIYEMLSLDQRRKQERKDREKAKKEAEKAAKRRGTRERKPSEEAGGGTSERARLVARGWSYEPRAVEGPPPAERVGPVPTRARGQERSTGSMTCSGIIALCIAKSELELSKQAWRPRREAVNTAIRDGVAWMAEYFLPNENPSSGPPRKTTGWKYYYLYSVERAGVLAGTYRFGPRDWWDEGAAHLLTQQRDEGSWPDAQGLSRLSRTCFALLFLKRSTVPLMHLPPKRVMTGQGK